MILHRDGPSRRGDTGVLPSSVPAMGRALRRERTRRGLRLEDVSLQTGLPPNDLDALEAGTVDRIPDQVQILKILRRYADFLGLPGDRYVVILVDHWPSGRGPAPAVVSVDGVPMSGSVPGSRSTNGDVPAAASPGAPPGATNGAGQLQVAQAPTAVPMAAAAGSGSSPRSGSGDATGVVPATGVPPDTGTVRIPPGTGETSAVMTNGGPDPETAQVPLPVADTGVTSAVRVRRRRRRPGAPLLLRLVVAVVALLVVVGAAGLAVNHYRPQWLRHLGIDTGSTTPTTGATSGAGGSSRSAGAVPAPVHARFSLASTTSTGATFVVRSPAFEVNVAAVGGEAWVQQSGTSGMLLTEGQSKVFPARQALTIEIGSKAAHVYVLVDKKIVGFYFPTIAPYTLNFRSTA